MSTIGLKIVKYDSIATCISIIRKYSKASMADIKTAIEANDFVFYCSYFRTSGIRKVRKCYDELTKAGAVVEFYEDDELISSELICNLIESHDEIDKQIEQESEYEADEAFFEALENNVCPECGAMLIDEMLVGATRVRCSKCEWALISTWTEEDTEIYGNE